MSICRYGTCAATELRVEVERLNRLLCEYQAVIDGLRKEVATLREIAAAEDAIFDKLAPSR